MGSVAPLGRGGLAGADVGATPRSEEHGGAEEVAWLRRAPAETDIVDVTRTRDCQKVACMSKVKSLKSEVKALKSELRPLKSQFDAAVRTMAAGQTRALHAELLEVQRRLEAKDSDLLQAIRQRTKSAKDARHLAEENLSLLSRVAELTASYASLVGRHAASEKKAKFESRQAAQRERQLLAQLGRTEAAAAAKVKAAEAGVSADCGLLSTK